MSARALVPLVRTLERAGVDVDAFFARYRVDGLKAALKVDSEERFASASLEGLWADAALAAGDPLFGVHAAASIEEHSFGIFGYLAATSATWGQALERVCRYFRLLTDSGHYELSAAGGASVLAFRPDPALRPAAELCDFVVAVPFQYGLRNVADFRALEVWLPYPEPAHGREIERFFGAPVRFLAPGLALIFPAELMGATLRTATPELARVLEEVAAEKLAALPASGDPLALMRRALHDALRGGDASLDAVARRMNLTPRSLQRHLKTHGKGFSAELDGVRRDLALALVSQPLTLQEVAFLLGFSEPAAFHRAFRRWTGEAPGQYRTRARSG